MSETLPRVSFVIVAFNQSAYIDDAVAAALAQDYPNLQIVLSDDNSSDDTFARMQAIAAAYTGRHTIVLNRTGGGRGVLAHFYDALAHADGELMVGAAGDDMSAPDRVSRLVANWHGTGAAGIYSAWNRVDVTGRFLACEGIAEQHDRDMTAYFPDRDVRIAFGCTAAYDIAFLRSIPIPAQTIWSEDYFWSAVAMMAGRDILYLEEPLVDYRQNPTALRNFSSGKVDHRAYELGENRFFTGLGDLLDALVEILDAGTPPVGTRVDRAAILHDIAWYRYRAEWPGRSLAARIGYTAGLRARDRLRWALPRVIGLEAFLVAKRLGRPGR